MLLAALVAGPRVAAHAGEPDPDALKKLSLEELLDLEVTSVSRRPERLAEAASAIQVITAEDIRRSGATSLPQALRLATNLQVAQVDSRQWAISARGFNSTTANKLLVLMDGRELYTTLFAGVFWDAQDTLLEDIERIEVISGPGATLWGANAVNGVINIITRSAEDTHGFLLLGGGGTEPQGFGGARYGGEARPGLHARVYQKVVGRGDAALPGGGSAGDRGQRGQGGFRVDWEPSEADLLTVAADVYVGHIDQPAMDDIDLAGGHLIARWRRAIAEGSSLQAQVYYDHTHRRIPDQFGEEVDTFDLDVQHRVPVGLAHDVVWGFGYRRVRDDVDNSPAFAFLPARVSQDRWSGFVQDEIALLPEKLHVALGAKLEHNDYTGFELAPGGRFSLKLSRQQVVWGAVSRALRTPSRIDRDFFVPATPPFVLAGGPGFVSEKLLAYELGYRAQPVDRVSLSVAAFYHDYDDVRGLQPADEAADAPLVIANRQRAESYGAEAAVDGRLGDRWRLRAGYTELRVDLRLQQQGVGVTTGESNHPERQLALSAAFDLAARLELDASLRRVARIATQDVPAYAELDLRIGWKPSPGLRLSIVGQGLLHDRHAEFGPARTRREIERGVHGKLEWRF